MLGILTMWMATMTPLVVDPSAIRIDAAFLAAVGAVLTALTGLLAGIAAFLVVLKKKVAEVHTLVNSHATDQTRQIESLTRALADAGVVIPQPFPPTVTGIPPSDVSVADAMS